MVPLGLDYHSSATYTLLPMDTEQIAILKHRLLQQKQEILDLEATLQEISRTVELDQSKVGRLSRMEAMQDQQMALQASRRRKQQLVDIEQAIDRMGQGEYGYCQQCGEEIAYRRLEFDPSTRLCIHCAS